MLDTEKHQPTNNIAQIMEDVKSSGKIKHQHQKNI